MPVSEASTLIINDLEGSGCFNIGTVVKTFLSCEKAMVVGPFLNRAVRGDAMMLRGPG